VSVSPGQEHTVPCGFTPSFRDDFAGEIGDFDFDGEIRGDLDGDNSCDLDGEIRGDLDGKIRVDLDGEIRGDFGEILGDFGKIRGDFVEICGELVEVPGDFDGEIRGNFDGEIRGDFEGEITGWSSVSFGSFNSELLARRFRRSFVLSSLNIFGVS